MAESPRLSLCGRLFSGVLGAAVCSACGGTLNGSAAAERPQAAVYNESALRTPMPKTPSAAATAVPAPALSVPLPETYEAALSELERLVGAMEAGQLPLDQLLDKYRRGADLLNFCRSRLEAVEQQVKVLEDGQLKPWNPAP